MQHRWPLAWRSSGSLDTHPYSRSSLHRESTQGSKHGSTWTPFAGAAPGQLQAYGQGWGRRHGPCVRTGVEGCLAPLHEPPGALSRPDLLRTRWTAQKRGCAWTLCPPRCWSALHDEGLSMIQPRAMQCPGCHAAAGSPAASGASASGPCGACGSSLRQRGPSSDVPHGS